MFMLTFLSQIHTACNSDANGINPGSELKMTDKHAVEYSMCVCVMVDIMKTSPCNKDPFTPHLYTVKLGFTGVYIILLILL